MALGFLAVAAVVVWAVMERSETVVLPAPSGPYAVGRVYYDWVDESRPEIFSPDQMAKRELMVWLWYPAEPSSAVPPAEYLPAWWGRMRESDQGIGALLFQSYDSVRVHSLSGAPVSAAQRNYPVLVMSAGFGRLPTDYTVLAEDLASHGYVVAGVANTYSAPVVAFPDGRVLRRVPEAALPESSPEAHKSAGDRLVRVWAADIITVINELEKLNAGPQGRFAGSLDMGRLGVFGHSFGGAASAEACRMDKRCKAGVDMDGTLYGDVVRAGVVQPFLLLSSEPLLGSMVEQDRPSFSSCLRNGASWIMIKGSRHFNFSDLAVTFAPVLRLGSMLGDIPGERGLRIAADYTRAFFDHYLNELDTPLLDGPSPQYPEIQFWSR